MPSPQLAELRELVESAAAEHHEPAAAALLRAAAATIEHARIVDEGGAAEVGERLARLAPEVLGALLRMRRAESGLSLRQVAQRSGVVPNTVRNLEKGATKPSAATLARLARLPELRLLPDTGGSAAGPRPNAWLLPTYDRRALIDDLQQVLNAPGGRLEQTSLYLDDLSAGDYLAVTTAPAFRERFRALPLDLVAVALVEPVGGMPLDLVALGPGDGRSETELAKELLRAVPSLRLRIFLLDISHTLLTLAYGRARAALPAGVVVEALHGDFRHMARYAVLHRDVAPRHRRCFVLLGGTLANVDNEVLFIRDGLSQSQSGDLAVVDFQCAWADRRDPDAVRRADPTLQGPPPDGHARWFTGPLRRYAAGVDGYTVGVELMTDCLIEGSYELDCYADARRGSRVDRYHLFRVRRYEPSALLATFARLGWQTVTCLRYGPSEMSAVAVLRKS